MTHKIALYPGDGIGPEVVAEARKVLESLKLDMQFTQFDWNTSLYAKTGSCVPDDFIDTLRPFDAILLGALGNKANAPESLAVAPLLNIRRYFDQYVNVRPSINYPGIDVPLKNRKPFDIDMVVIRENTEGEYTTLGGRHYAGLPQESAMQISYFTRQGCERIMRYAFETAMKRPRKHLTSITKSNALVHSMVFWDECFARVAKEFPEVKTSAQYVDAAAMNLVRSPEMFDVVVSSNLFGDIITDVSAVVTGGIGFAGSGNINPSRSMPSMFEPVHGSAPDIAGRGIANPVAAIMSASLMCDFLGEKDAAKRIEKAVIAHLEDGKVKTPDRGGNNTTVEVGKDILGRL
ncbi:MAG TPA: 3-isopropylmalate dehydrogenase [Spirochaetota bacterium]|nr:3-isopropylmalate dehydrogenase [Spirochaetota bacterium]